MSGYNNAKQPREAYNLPQTADYSIAISYTAVQLYDTRLALGPPAVSGSSRVGACRGSSAAIAGPPRSRAELGIRSSRRAARLHGCTAPFVVAPARSEGPWSATHPTLGQ